MKYLIKFNESVKSDKTEEILNFCNIYLVDLLDLGYTIDVRKIHAEAYSRDADGVYYKTLIKIDRSDKKWIDIKEYFIPFFEFLIKKYKIKPYGIDSFYNTPECIYVPDKTGFHTQYYTDENILEDRIPDTRPFTMFYINIEGKI